MKRISRLILSLAPPLLLCMPIVCIAAEKAVVPEGTCITLQLNKSLSTKQNKVGDTFDAYVIEPVYYKGRIAIPKGSVVSGSIARISRPGRFKGKAVMHLIFQSISIPGRGKISINASLTRIDSDEDEGIHTETAQKVPAPKTTPNLNKIVFPELAGSGVNSLAEGNKSGHIETGTGIGSGQANVFWTRGKDL